MPDHAPQTRASLPTTALLMVGTLLIMLAFIASYVGALHDPEPHALPIGVVGTSSVVGPVKAQITAQAPSLKARTYATTQDARTDLRNRTIYAALVPQPGSKDDILYVASAANPMVSSELVSQAVSAEQGRGRGVQVRDIAPLPKSDPRGLTAFYLVVGWVVGGYLTATILGLRRGMRPLRVRAAVLRVLALAVFAAAGGAASVAYLEHVQRVLHGHEVQLMGVGALTIAASALSASAIMSVLGIIGTGVVILVYVVIGNPSSGGPFPYELLPRFWRTVGPYLPPGAGTDATRNTLYFNGNALSRPIIVLAVYAVAGTLLLLLSSAIGSARRRHRMLSIEAAVADTVAAEGASDRGDGKGATRNTFFDRLADDRTEDRRSENRRTEDRRENERSTWTADTRDGPLGDA